MDHLQLHQALDKLVARACTDLDFRARLLKEPQETLKLMDAPLPPGQDIVLVDLAALDQSQAAVPLVIYLPPPQAALFGSDEQFLSTLGGADNQHCCAG